MTEPTIAEAIATKQAVTYLRVSTKQQLYTAIDIDPDGNSIATQREAAHRKCETLGLPVGKEFLEPGNSAQTIDKRPVFKEMLAYLKAHPEVGYVVIYMRSRAFRNYIDAGVTERQLLAPMGVKLISAKEDFGEGIWGDAMKAVADVMNEVQVRMSGDDIRTKMQHKAQNGGTVGRARLGYLNVRAEIDGRLVNTIALDPERAPLVCRAFELYASGDFTIRQLAETMADQGLTTRPSARWAAKPVSVQKFSELLRDPYYTGVVVYKGEIIPDGRHEALISHELFQRVQEILASRRQRGTRTRVHTHYLRGMLFCERCERQRSKRSRLIYTRSRGQTGVVYEYFKCAARQYGGCDLPHLPVWLVEETIEREYGQLRVGDDFSAEVRQLLDASLHEEQALVSASNKDMAKELAKLQGREERLLDLAEAGDLAQASVKRRLRTLQLERARLTETLDSTAAQLEAGVTALGIALRLVKDPAALYSRAPDEVRRQLNRTFFTAFYIDEDSHRPVLNTPFDDILAAAEVFGSRTRTSAVPSAMVVDIKKGRSGRATGSDLPLMSAAQVKGWSKRGVVGATGFEPVTSAV